MAGETQSELVEELAALRQRVEQLERSAAPELPVTGLLGRLSAAEHAIARHVLRGQTNEQIARELHYSPKTVEWTLTKVYRKLHVRTRTELAVRLAHELHRPPLREIA
jgi:DNA-binding NarL/FixJ family response regulator